MLFKSKFNNIWKNDELKAKEVVKYMRKGYFHKRNSFLIWNLHKNEHLSIGYTLTLDYFPARKIIQLIFTHFALQMVQ